jgi:cell division septation protein DedD
VNDAYVRNFNSGAKVQMGVFSEAERAEELTQDLQRRGIPAQVLREGN